MKPKRNHLKLVGTKLPDELVVYTTTIGKNSRLLGKLNKANGYTITLPANSISLAIGKAVIPKIVVEENLASATSFFIISKPGKHFD